MIKIYADGACTKQGDGGWAIVVKVPGGPDLEGSGPLSNSTNNIAELTAAIKALEFFEDDRPIEIISDSQYVVKGASEWLYGWKMRNWRTAELKPVKNVELWKHIDALCAGRKVKWTWVKGHNGDPDNERCDRLAQAASRGADPGTLFKPTHIHKKTGNKYRLIRDERVKTEADWEDAAIYEAEDGMWIVRNKAEFYERFEAVRRGERITKPEPL